MTGWPSGFVSLVGAGPGDPGLLTLAAAARLRDAEVVLHDALVPDAIVGLAPRALRVPVGKRAGRPSASQESINRLLVSLARRGRRVVRLKGGDPFVLGRGGEEGLALAAAGIPHEVIPGISSALAAPALSGIPVTHRGTASAFVVVSGHAEPAWRPVLASLAPGAATVVVLMGFASRGSIARALLGRGWNGATPVAVCVAAGTPDTRTRRGNLRGLAAEDGPEDDGLPATLVVGEVVALAERLAPSAFPEDRAEPVERSAHVRGR